MNVVSGVFKGSLSVLVPNPRDISGLIEIMKAVPFNGMYGVNTLYASLMQHPEFDQVDFSHLKGRGVIAGGAALMTDVAEQWERRTGCPVLEGYGLSETSAALTCNTPTEKQLGTVGKVLPAMEVKTINADGESIGIGEAGELLVRGPHVTLGYWQCEEATAEAIDDEGWFRTGDVAVIQDDGYVRIVDRIKDMIIVSGFNVYPNEIEDVASSHVDILECAVVGIPDSKTGEAVKIFIVSTNPDLSEQDVIAHCREQLTSYKVPKKIEFRDDLPKSNVGKILRRELRE